MVLIAANLLAWAWAFAAFHGYPFLLATALIAYGFGLRHAVDADHIAAIDNVTRKLMQEDKRPIAVGFFFSLGHSTVVIAAAILIALTASSVQRSFPRLIEAGGLIGTLVSVIFLFAIAMINPVGADRCLSRLPAGEPRGRLCRGGAKRLSRPARAAQSAVPNPVPIDFAQLEHVSARAFVRTRL